MDRASRNVWRWAGVFISAGLLGLAVTARAAGVPPRGAEAPAFTLENLQGERVELAQFAGHPVVLVFGDLQHEGAQKASRELLRVLKDDRLEKQGIVPIFLTAQHAENGELAKLLESGHFPALVLHDPARDAFGAYQILVVPSVVIVNAEGVVVHAMPGFLPRFTDLLTQSLLVATGQMSDAAFEASLGLTDNKSETDPNALRAERLVHLGEQLLEHGMEDMAEARFREAVEILPGSAAGRLALGELYRARGKADEAEAQIRALLSADPDSVDAQLALARIQIDRGGSALDEAEKGVRNVLEHHPKTPRAHYQLGLILQARGDDAGAAGSFRQAAELLLGN